MKKMLDNNFLQHGLSSIHDIQDQIRKIRDKNNLNFALIVGVAVVLSVVALAVFISKCRCNDDDGCCCDDDDCCCGGDDYGDDCCCGGGSDCCCDENSAKSEDFE